MFDRQSLVNVTLKIRTPSFTVIGWLDSEISCTPFLKAQFREKRVQSFRKSSFICILYSLFLLVHRGLQFLQFTTELNPSPLIFDSPEVIFESHDLHLIILFKVASSDTNSIILCPRIYYCTPKGQDLLHLISKISNYY